MKKATLKIFVDLIEEMYKAHGIDNPNFEGEEKIIICNGNNGQKFDWNENKHACFLESKNKEKNITIELCAHQNGEVEVWFFDENLTYEENFRTNKKEIFYISPILVKELALQILFIEEFSNHSKSVYDFDLLKECSKNTHLSQKFINLNILH